VLVVSKGKYSLLIANAQRPQLSVTEFTNLLGQCSGDIFNEQLCGFLLNMEKNVMKFMGILPLVPCYKTIGKIFPRNK
jgi:hypothetical protein